VVVEERNNEGKKERKENKKRNKDVRREKNFIFHRKIM